MADRSASVYADGRAPDGLIEAFWRYETALMADDVPELDALFAPGDFTMRGDAGGLLVGHDAIAGFRRGRGGAPKRRIGAVHVRVLGADLAAVVAVLEPAAGGRGQQTQVWRRGPDGWQVLVAHVAGPAPAVDARVWREVGTPLVAGATGPLVGRGVAVKDLFAIAGHRIGGGVPAYLAAAAFETSTAPAVQALLDAGAHVAGIARTDELAYSIAGANPHYGTPPNARVPGALPGGSSNGPASAVALGQAAIGLATDTGGSIRVPASYQGLWGLRTTHDRVPRDGLLPLAPSFDTAGWLTRDRAVLAACSRVSAIGAPAVALPDRFVVDPGLLADLDPAVLDAFQIGAAELLPAVEQVDLGDVAAAQEAFRVVQAAEAWRTHGAWLTAHPGAVMGAVAARFEAASRITADEAARAVDALQVARARFEAALDGAVLVLPSAASIAPQTTADAAAIDRVRSQTLRLTCVAGILGAPALSAPVLEVAGAPLGLCLVGPRDSDDALLHFAATFVV